MSVWEDIGMLGGKFKGAIPCRYFNSLFYFFQKLHVEGARILDELGIYETNEKDIYVRWGENTTADGVRKDAVSNEMLAVIRQLNENIFSVERAYYPLKKEFFTSPTPEWNDCVTAPDSVEWIQGEILEAYVPEKRGYSWEHLLAWGEQKYQLVQLMRYIRVPVKFSFASSKYLTSGLFSLNEYQYTIELPDFWKKGSAKSKLAVRIFKENQQATNKWVDSSIKLSQEDGYQVEFYGAVDLSTHPDFAEYFDDDFVFPSIDCGGGDSSSIPESSVGGSSSSSSTPPPPSSSSTNPPSSSTAPHSSSTNPPSSSTNPPSSSTAPHSSAGGEGDDVLEFIGFEVNTLHRNCGVVTPYVEEWIGDDTPDPQHFCYATSWNMPDAESTGRFSTVNLGSISCDVAMNACWGWDEAQIEEATLAMHSAQEYINARIPNAPWLRIAPIISNYFVEAAPGGIDYNKNTGRITIEQWAFTGNASHGNPCQAFGELTLVNLPAGVSAVWVEVWGKEYKLTIGDVLGWDELRHVFALGELPLTVIGTCGGEEGGPTWPVIQNAENSAYPWGGIGTRQTLEMTVKRWERSNTRTTTVNAYLNDLPEEFR